MWNPYEEGADLDSMIGAAIERFEDERRAHWEDVDAYFEWMDELARMIVMASDAFVGPDETTPLTRIYSDPDLPEFLANQQKFLERNLALERLQIIAARRFSTNTAQIADRYLQLTREVLLTKPGPTVIKYLHRISRCYLVGFDTECVVLCRAVIENGVKDAFARKGIPLPEDESGRSPMRTRLDAAQRFLGLSSEKKKDADWIWKRGNKAVHDDPDATTDVIGTIRMTIGVLQELYDR
jgi:hypothetical protein